MGITHAFTSAKEDSDDPTIIQPSNWNEDHIVPMQRLSRTAGSLTLTNSTTTSTEISSALRLTIAASTGDIIVVGMNALVTAGNAGECAISSATIVSGSITNGLVAGTRPVGHGYTATFSGVQVSTLFGGVITYTVVSGDISGGNVTVSPTFIQTGGGDGTLYATSTYAFTYWVFNLGH